jgi:hypothetical protein
MQEFDAILEQDDETTGTGIYLPFDPREAFGRARAPVRGTINGAPFRSTVAVYGGRALIPVRKELREAAGAKAGDTVHVVMEPDDAPRGVEIPKDLAASLDADPTVRERFDALSFTHRKEYVEWVEGAKKPDTRERRIRQTVDRLRAE